MKYEARVTLAKVEYRGANLGSNIRVNVTIAERSQLLRFSIKPGETRLSRKLIYNEQTVASTISLSASASATEVDPVHNDAGLGATTLRFDAGSVREAVLEVPIHGDPKGDKGKDVISILAFSGIRTETGERFASFVEPEGWLKIKNEDDRAYPSVIPFALRVIVTSNDGVREFFTIEEAQLKGNKGSVKLKDDSSSYLDSNSPHTAAVTLRFSTRDEILTIDGREERYWAVTDPDNPVPTGTHDLEIPYELHNYGAGYLRIPGTL